MKELALYLSRKKNDYKYGLPQYSENNEARMLFIYSKESKANLEFLHSIVEKGFGLRARDQSYIAVDGSSDSSLETTELMHADWRAVIVFGEKFADQVKKGSSKLVIVPDIEKVRSTPEVKKQFWNRVKTL